MEETLPTEPLDTDTIVKLAIKAFLLKSLGQVEKRTAPELEDMAEEAR